MQKRWTDKDLMNLQKRGLTIQEQMTNTHFIPELSEPIKETKAYPLNLKPVIISPGKKTIELLLQEMKTLGVISGYVRELKFDEVRRFRFDWAIPELKLAIEYEGLNSKKSRHTTKKGYTGDCEKYNTAILNGWKVLRYTALNYSDFAQDIKIFLRKL